MPVIGGVEAEKKKFPMWVIIILSVVALYSAVAIYSLVFSEEANESNSSDRALEVSVKNSCEQKISIALYSDTGWIDVPKGATVYYGMAEPTREESLRISVAAEKNANPSLGANIDYAQLKEINPNHRLLQVNDDLCEVPGS